MRPEFHGCASCGKPFRVNKTGRPSRYCGPACWPSKKEQYERYGKGSTAKRRGKTIRCQYPDCGHHYRVHANNRLECRVKGCPCYHFWTEDDATIWPPLPRL